MDEAGQSGDSGAATGGSGGDPRDRALTNGWPTTDSPWSNAGAALDPEDEDPAPWRRPAEIRPFARRSFATDRPSGEIHRFGDQDQSADVRPFAPRATDDVVRGYADPGYPSAGGSPESPDPRAYHDPPRPSRFSDLLSRFPTSGGRAAATPIEPVQQPRPEPARPAPPQPVAPPPGFRSADLPRSDFQPGNAPTSGFRGAEALTSGFRGAEAPASGFGPVGVPDPLSLAEGVPDPPAGADRRLGDLRAVDAPPPSSAPPFPYEGDLDDAGREALRPVGQQRTAVPLSRPFRPGPPGGRRADWNAPESARHAREPGIAAEEPRLGSPAAPPEAPPATPDTTPPRPSYDPATFPRRLPYEAPAGAPADTSAGYAPAPAYPAGPGRTAGEPGAGPADRSARTLPQRVPAEPDVPVVPEPPPVEPTAETPALARIATHLRRGDVLPAEERQEGFDVTAILAAVREVDGVRDAKLRTTEQGAHSLRLDLAEGADPAEVSRQVARLLQDRMGLDAAMKGATGMPAPPPAFAPTPQPAVRPAVGADPRPVAGRPGTPPPDGGEASPDGLPARPAAAASAPVPPAAPSRVPGQPIPAGRAPVSGGPSGAPTQPLPASRGQTPPPLPPRSRTGHPAEPGLATTPLNPAAQGPPAPAAGAAPASAAPATERSPTGPSYVPGPSTAAEAAPLGGELGPPRPLSVGETPGPRAVIENVQVTTFGIKASVEVHLAAGDRIAMGTATGPSLDGYLLRLCAMATADAIDDMLARSEHADGPARCHIHHAAVVPFGSVQVAVVVVLLSCGTWVDQLAGSAVVTGDDGRAMVQATMAAVNRRLEALLS